MSQFYKSMEIHFHSWHWRVCSGGQGSVYMRCHAGTASLEQLDAIAKQKNSCHKKGCNDTEKMVQTTERH